MPKIRHNPFSYLYAICLIFSFSFAMGCGDDEPSVDCTLVNISVNVSASISQCPDATGTISVTASGGVGNFQYSLDGQNFQDNGNFENISGGEYTVTARDGDGCISTTNITVEEESDISFTTTSTEAGCGGNTGTLMINATGGSGSYTYMVDGSNFQNSNEFQNLSNGIHIITVRDSNNCESQGEGYVKSGISFEAEVEDIIITFCAVSGCHVASEPRPDFNIFANIKSNALDIKTRTQSRNMPRGTSLTDEQIDIIACWVDDGALNN